SQAVNKSPTHYPCDSARTFRVILFSIHNDEWKSFQCHHQTALRSYALSWKPCQGDSLNLPDHRIHKDGDEEAASQVHATYERIVTESDPSLLEEDHWGVQTLTPEEQLAANTMQALKVSRKSTGSQPHDGGSREGTGTKPGVPDQSTVILKTLGEGTGAKPGGSKNESDYSEEENVYEEIDWVYSNEEDEKKDDDDDDKNDVDKEMKDAKVAESGNGDEEITDTSKADAKKTEEVKDDNKKAELPPSSLSLSASSGIGNKFLNLSSDKCTVRNLKDSTDAEINSLLDVQIQQQIPHILSLSVLTVPVFGDF
ncbi:hypothetical protein Tco_1375414, partial [Tanacetum coccineum]